MSRQECSGQMHVCFTTGLHGAIFRRSVLMARGLYCSLIKFKEEGMGRSMRHLFFPNTRGSIFVPSLLAVFLCLLLVGCTVNVSTSGGTNTPTPATTATSGTPHWGVQTKTSGCSAHNGLPDSACTPGDIIPSATKSVICQKGYASSVRNVPDSEKLQDYAEYGITHH